MMMVIQVNEVENKKESSLFTKRRWGEIPTNNGAL
jgi:hypothetical protein